MRKQILCILLFITGWGALYAFDLGEAGSISVNLQFDVHALEVKTVTRSDEGSRAFAGRDTGTVISWLPKDSWGYWEDGGVRFEYTGPFYGGKVVIDQNGLGGLKFWANIGSILKVSLGTDIGAGYADALDADPGTRVYTGVDASEDHWKDSIDPDNITQDRGVMLEGFIGPVTVALAGFDSNIAERIGIPIPNTQNTEWEHTERQMSQFGARIGSTIGNWGKVNGSYILQYSQNGESYKYNTQDKALHPDTANAEVYTHNFGLYASLTPLKDLDITLGWAAVYTKYLDEFYRGANAVETMIPSVFRNGLNLNARYKGIPKLTIRTDHNYSFWSDRDYRILVIPTMQNPGLESKAGDDAYSNVEHWLLWNGLGVSYDLNDHFTLSVYVRNLRRQDSAGDYTAVRNQFFVEPKLNWKVDDRLGFYVGFNWENYEETMSEDLNKQRNVFVNVSDVKATSDTTGIIRILLGMSLKF